MRGASLVRFFHKQPPSLIVKSAVERETVAIAIIPMLVPVFCKISSEEKITYNKHLNISFHTTVHRIKSHISGPHPQAVPNCMTESCTTSLTAQTPSTRSLVFPNENGHFFLRIRLPSSRSRLFQAPKTEVFKYKIFENGDLSHSCGRAKTQIFKYDDVMPRLQACSAVLTIRKRYAWTQILFNRGDKNLHFRKYPATCVGGLSLQCLSSFDFCMLAVPCSDQFTHSF